MSGTTYHTGQLFVNDSLSDAVDQLPAYIDNAHGTRTLLTQDRVYTTQDGVDAIATVDYVDPANFTSGLIITATVTISTTTVPAPAGGGTGNPSGNPPSATTASSANILTVSMLLITFLLRMSCT